MCNDETGATAHQLKDGFLYLQFGPGIHARGLISMSMLTASTARRYRLAGAALG